MVEVECVTLEDGLKYLVVTTINDHDNCYMYLSEENNVNNFCIRKVIKKDNGEVIVPLENKEEFELALNLFKKKNC